MNRTSSNYDASFTAGGLLLNEFLAIKIILLSDSVVKNLKNEIEENKVIGLKTRATRERIINEISRRVNQVPKSFWDFFYSLNLTEQKQALLYLCLKAYPLIFDIHFEVAVKKFKTSGRLTEYDIQMRLDEIASTDDYVAGWSEATFKKLNTRYRKALMDAGLFNGENLISSEVHNPEFWNYFKDKADTWFLTACFK